MAAEEKLRLEKRQRERRVLCDSTRCVGEDEVDYKYNGKYFNARERGVWPLSIPDLFN